MINSRNGKVGAVLKAARDGTRSSGTVGKVHLPSFKAMDKRNASSHAQQTELLELSGSIPSILLRCVADCQDRKVFDV